MEKGIASELQETLNENVVQAEKRYKELHGGEVVAKKLKLKNMTEDFVVENLCRWLIAQGYQIDNSCTGAKPGNDIEASKNDKKLIVEAKGAKGNLSHTTREKFDSGQIKTHLGKALVKVLEQKAIYPEAEIAIAHPHDEYLMKVMETIRPEIKKLGIKMFWVKDENSVIED